MEIVLNRNQKAQLKPLKEMMDDAPGGTSTLAQVIWRPSGEVVVKVELVNAKPFRRIWEIARKPDALYRPNHGFHRDGCAGGFCRTERQLGAAAGEP